MKRILLTFALLIAGTSQALAGYTQVAGTVYFTDGHNFFTRQSYRVCTGWRCYSTRYRYVLTNWRPAKAKAKYEENWRDTITVDNPNGRKGNRRQ